MEDHEHHEASLEAFLKADKHQGSCVAYSLAEFYAVVTRLPGRHRLSGEQALLFLQEIRERLTIITLTAQEYFTALQCAAEADIVGGTVYDVLLVSCAAKAGALTLLIWNVKHFRRFSSGLIKRVATP
jgi:predicted nucleic acid-binding protein